MQAGLHRQPSHSSYLEASDGTVSRILARSVIDPTGTSARPNPLGAEGYPAAGESAAADRISYGMPDPATDQDQYAGSATAVVGSGASALTSLNALTSDSLQTRDCRAVWVLRRGLSAIPTVVVKPTNCRPAAPWATGSAKRSTPA